MLDLSHPTQEGKGSLDNISQCIHTLGMGDLGWSPKSEHSPLQPKQMLWSLLFYRVIHLTLTQYACHLLKLEQLLQERIEETCFLI